MNFVNVYEKHWTHIIQAGKKCLYFVEPMYSRRGRILCEYPCISVDVFCVSIPVSKEEGGVAMEPSSAVPGSESKYNNVKNKSLKRKGT